LRFSSLTGNGGVIFVDGGTYSMNVNYSMFHNCVCSSQGGAIFFKSSNSNLRMICSNRCSAPFYHFVYLYATLTNEVEYLSVSYCSNSTIGLYSMCLEIGNQRVDRTNSSMNNANWESGIYINSPSVFTSSQCSFSNNRVLGRRCISFSSITGLITMSYTNIVHNNSPNDGVVYVNGVGLKKMMYCIFQNNQNYLFCASNLQVSHSFIDHSSSSVSSGQGLSTISNNSFEICITYQIQYFSSLHCNADAPLPMKTLDQSPMRSLGETFSRTNEETLRLTFERTLNQTIRKTPLHSYKETPINTVKETLINTLKNTPINTINETLSNTLKNTPINTFNETPIITPKYTLKETVPRTYSEIICTNELVNKREISVIFSLFNLYILTNC